MLLWIWLNRHIYKYIRTIESELARNGWLLCCLSFFKDLMNFLPFINWRRKKATYSLLPFPAYLCILPTRRRRRRRECMDDGKPIPIPTRAIILYQTSTPSGYRRFIRLWQFRPHWVTRKETPPQKKRYAVHEFLRHHQDYIQTLLLLKRRQKRYPLLLKRILHGVFLITW